MTRTENKQTITYQNNQAIQKSPRVRDNLWQVYTGFILCDKGVLRKDKRNVKQPNNSRRQNNVMDK
jgi:hypothetical protein